MAPAIDFTLVAMLAVAAALVSSTGGASTTEGSEDAICLSQERAYCENATAVISRDHHAIRDKQAEMEKQLFSLQDHLELLQEKMDQVIHILQSQNNSAPVTHSVAPAPDNLESINQTVNNSDTDTVYPDCVGGVRPFSAPCDTTTDGGGWTVIQRRGVYKHRPDFNRTWSEFEEGFGDPTEEFWLGITHIRALVSEAPMELRIDLEAFTGERRSAKYDSFSVDDADRNYRLHLGTHSGNLYDQFTQEHDGKPFSTKDRDNDEASYRNCAAHYGGGWWYSKCMDVNLNGVGHNNSDHEYGINWWSFPQIGYIHLKSSAMMVRPRE